MRFPVIAIANCARPHTGLKRENRVWSSFLALAFSTVRGERVRVAHVLSATRMLWSETADDYGTREGVYFLAFDFYRGFQNAAV